MRRENPILESFEESINLILSEFSVEYINYREMSHIIDGPFNPPSEIEIKSGSFEREYFQARRVFIDALGATGIAFGKCSVMDFADGSRCLGVYLGEEVHLLQQAIRAGMTSLDRLRERDLIYCVSINLDVSYPDAGSLRTAYWYLGICETDLKCCVRK